MPFSPIPEILEELRAGRMIVLVDDASRENEGDLVIAAEKVTPEAINFMARYGRGLVCLALSPEKVERLRLPLMTGQNESRYGTAFTVSIEARTGVSTGISAHDRAHTILTAAKPDARPEDLVSPGHVFPLRAREGGVLVRAGQTEGAVDLTRMAGMIPAGVICEIMNEDGTMARLPDLEKFIERWHSRPRLCSEDRATGGGPPPVPQAAGPQKMASVADVIEYRRRSEKLVERGVSVKLPTRWGRFDLVLYKSFVDPSPHLALCMGGIGTQIPPPDLADRAVLVRVHSECLTGDVFGSMRCDCGTQVRNAMEMIAREKLGVLLYMRQEGRGIGLENKLKAYHLQQEHGLDTVEANEQLGFPADKRDYGIGAQILVDLGVRNIRLMTNNPRKMVGLEGYGLRIIERVPLIVPANEESIDYLRTKRDKLGHLFDEL
jgi:3,4-dihydroxy 2-butanone 4-phosphate synthase/GTP cyclohydrolase II